MQRFTVEQAPRTAPLARSAAALIVAAAVLAAGCASGPLLDRAVRARGGPLQSFVRVAEADVQAGFPGTWRWRMAFLAPDRYAWSIVTTAGVDHYLFDGRAVRAIVGGRAVATDTAASSPLRTQAAFVAVTNLDTARAAGTATPLAPSELPPGVTTGVSVVMPPSGARYRLGFDDRLLLVWATGPFDVPQVGLAELTARYDDYRRVGGLWLPFRAVYEVGPRRLAVEQTLRLCTNDPRLTPASFEDAAALPAFCGEP